MPSPIGHIRNRAATRATTGDIGVGAGIISRAPENLAALDEVLAEMRAAKVRLIAVEGGDGTVREIVTRAFSLWPDQAPEFAIIAAGNTNLIARSAGRVKPADLGRLAEAQGATRRELPVLKLERAGASPIRGFIAGAGAYAAATKLARTQIGARHGAQVALAVIRLLRSPELRAPTSIGFGADLPASGSPPRMLVALTSLRGALIFGLDPFWGGGSGPIRWLDIAGDPPRPLLAAPFVAFGAPRRWMRGYYSSGRATAGELILDAPFVVDGEEFAPGADGKVSVSAAESATFLSW